MWTHHARLSNGTGALLGALLADPLVRRVVVEMGAKGKRFYEVEYIYNVKEGRKGKEPFNGMLGLNVD